MKRSGMINIFSLIKIKENQKEGKLFTSQNLTGFVLDYQKEYVPIFAWIRSIHMKIPFWQTNCNDQYTNPTSISWIKP